MFPRPRRRFAFAAVHDMDAPSASFVQSVNQNGDAREGELPSLDAATAKAGSEGLLTKQFGGRKAASSNPASGDRSPLGRGSHPSSGLASHDSLLALLRSLGSDEKETTDGAVGPAADQSTPSRVGDASPLPKKGASLSSRFAASTLKPASKVSSLSSLPGSRTGRSASGVALVQKASLRGKGPAGPLSPPAPSGPALLPKGGSRSSVREPMAEGKENAVGELERTGPRQHSEKEGEKKSRASSTSGSAAQGDSPTLLNAASLYPPERSSFFSSEFSYVAEDEGPFDALSPSQSARRSLGSARWSAQEQEEQGREDRVLPLLTLPVQTLPLGGEQDVSNGLASPREPTAQGVSKDRSLPWEQAAAAHVQQDRERFAEDHSRARFPLVSDLFSPTDKTAYLGMLDAYGKPRRRRALLTAPSSALFVPPLHEASRLDLECGEFRPAHDLKSEADAALCRVFGPGLEHAEAGRLANFTIQAVNADGAFLRSGDASFTVYVDRAKVPAAERPGTRWRNGQDTDGPEDDYDSDAERLNQYRPPGTRSAHRRRKDTLDGYVYNRGDGTYTVHYYCTVAAPHSIYVYLNDRVLVADSPYRVNVQPGATTAECSEAYGDGTKFFALGGGFSEIVIQAKDASGNNVKTGGDTFTVTASGAAKIVETTDMNDGTYWVKYYVPQGAEKHFVEIRISYHGRAIKGAPFRPRPGGPVEDEPPPERLSDTVNVTNPLDSLMTLAERCRERWSQTKNPPALSPYPPFPSLEEATRILQKANLDYDAVVTDTTEAHLRETTQNLVQYSKDLLNRDSTIQSVMKNLKAHGRVGSFHDVVEKGNRERLNQYIDFIARLQEGMDVTYKSIHYAVVDSLPVALELENPTEVREAHRKRRQDLIQRHKNMEKKEAELRQREARFKAQRLKFVSGMAEELERRRKAVEAEKAALKENTQYILRLTQLSLKKHLRREMLTACEREPVEAFKSSFWQRDFSRMLIDVPAASDGKKAGAEREVDDEDRSSEAGQLPPTKPDDPTRPSAWLQKGEFVSGGSSPFGIQRVAHDADARLIRARRTYGGGNPTYVSYSLGSFAPPPSGDSRRQESPPGKRDTRHGLPPSSGGSDGDADRPTGIDAESKKEEKKRVRFEDRKHPGFPFSDLPNEFAIPHPRPPPPAPPPRYL
uniref:Gelation factor, related n=1 Tax=Neospora caninum (strain Liverpool) TaxID=572307 RepID=A0A0F7U6Y1_NEOCL|nr:TPA: Gelation factor, related [Neospora caninum Liverpool]